MAVTLKLSQAAAHYRQLGRRFWPAVMAGARAGGERARAHLVQRSQELAFDRGGYARGWKVSLSVGEKTLTIYNQAPYSSVIEQGRRPGARQPPTKALVPWVRRKLGIGRRQAEGVAFLVARKIGRDGIPGKLILTRARGRVVRLLLEEIESSLVRALRGG